MEEKQYDVAIIGGGPAGVTAGIYATRFGLKTVIIEEMTVGGQSSFTYEIDNYPGLPKISGMELGSKFSEHAEELGVEFVFDSIKSCDIKSDTKTIETEYSGVFTAKAIILCLGAKPRCLNLTSEEKYIGNGISFCATCDGAFYKDAEVAVVGGGNSALEEALFLSQICKKVHIIHVLDNFQANDSMVEKIKTNEKIDYVLNTKVVEYCGEGKLTSIVTENEKTGEKRVVEIDGMFIAIGRVPASDIVKDVVDLDKYGYILSDEDMKTNVSGVYVAGDVRAKKVRQIVTACSDGAIAATSVNQYLIENNIK